MNKIVKFLGPVLILIGSIVAYFSPVAIVDYIGIGVAALGLGLSIVNTLKKAEKIDWKVIVPVVCFAIGGLCFGVAGFSEDKMTTLAMAAFGLVGIIIGLITAKNKIEK